jgi:hypothetical protein
MLALSAAVATYYCHDCAKVISGSRVDVRQKALEAVAYQAAIARHRQVVGERDIYPGRRSESGSTRGASHVGPGLERPSAGKAMISGIGVGKTAEEVCHLIVD